MPEPLQRLRSSLLDQHDRFGWVSIALHWLSAIVIVTLWFLGWSLTLIDAGEVDAQRRLHMSIGLSAWLLIFMRIAWRIRTGHPRASGLGNLTHQIAKASHYLLLAALSIMLVSGPLMAWSGGAAIPVFGWFAVPGPLGERPALQSLMHDMHAACATVIFWLTLLHVASAFKHLMFHDDHSFARMLWPGRPPRAD